ADEGPAHRARGRDHEERLRARRAGVPEARLPPLAERQLSSRRRVPRAHGDPMELDGKLALVTGAGSGIGRATANALAARGARLIVCDVDAARTQDVASELGARCVMSRAVDVGDRAAMIAFAEQVHEIGTLDVLVNNAGVAVGGGILDTTLENWD